MRIAIPVCGPNIATVFDFTDRLLVVDIAGNQIAGSTQVPVQQTLPSIMAAKLRQMNIDTLICGAVSNGLAAMVSHSGIHLMPGITGNALEVVAAHLGGQLTGAQYHLPGYGPSGRCGWWQGRARRFRGRRGRRFGGMGRF